jgi:hypothetical protein
MRTVLVSMLTLFLIKNISGQQNKVYIVRAGEVPSEVLPLEARYVFPTFKQGTAHMRDGTVSTAKLNYNIMLDEMQFIDNKGDTLAIAYPETIRSVTIDTTLYFYDKTYFEVVHQEDSFKLAKKQIFVQSPYRTRGGYDVPTAVSSITTYGSINASRGPSALQVKKDVQFHKVVAYVVSDKFNHFFKADKKAFLHIFPGKKVVIENYMKENHIDYFQPTDLEKLLRFCVSLN